MMIQDHDASATQTGLSSLRDQARSGPDHSASIPCAEERGEIDLLIKHYGGEIGNLAFYALRVGRFLERQRVSAWLEDQGDAVFRGGHPLWEAGAHNNLYRAARKIERGEHLAIAMETRSATTAGRGPQDDSAAIAQPSANSIGDVS